MLGFWFFCQSHLKNVFKLVTWYSSVEWLIIIHQKNIIFRAGCLYAHIWAYVSCPLLCYFLSNPENVYIGMPRRWLSTRWVTFWVGGCLIKFSSKRRRIMGVAVARSAKGVETPKLRQKFPLWVGLFSKPQSPTRVFPKIKVEPPPPSPLRGGGVQPD